jgi:hypothetical protein
MKIIDDSRKDFYISLLLLIAIIIIFSPLGYFFVKFDEASNDLQIKQQKEKHRIDSINSATLKKINYIDSMYHVLENKTILK